MQARNSAEANREREITDDDLRNCTFQPLVTHLPVRQVAAGDVHERLYDNARQKQAMLAAATLGVPLEQYASFAGGDGDEGDVDGDVVDGEDVEGADEPEEGTAAAVARSEQEIQAASGTMFLI